MPNEFLKEVQRQAAENFNAQQKDNNLMDAEQFMGQFGYKPRENLQNEETANNGFLGWAKDAIDSGVAGVLGGQTKLADTFLGVGGDATKYFGDVAKRNARTKEYKPGDIVPFASDYYTNPQGFTYDTGNLIGSMLALGGETAVVAQAAAPVLAGLGYEGLSAVAGTLAGRAAAAGMPALANALRSKLGTLILANVAKTPFEVASEMGNTVEDMENKGASLDEQKKAAIMNGLVQMPLLTLSNTVEGMGLGSLIGGSAKTAFGKATKAAAGIAGGAAQQSWEEGMQAASSNYASGDRKNPWGIVNPTDWKEDEMQQASAAFAPGMLFGGLGVGAGHVAHKMGAISDLTDSVKGNGGGSPPDGYPKDDSVSNDNNNFGGSSIVENMAALEGNMPYHVPEGTTCMRSVSTAVRNATGGAWPQIDYVPSAIEKAQEMGLWHDADYQPKAGDIAIVNGDNHAVMYDGEGGTWQSGESHNGIYHSAQSPTEMFGKVTGWISTSDLANGKGGNSAYSLPNAQNNMQDVMDFLKENQFVNDNEENNVVTEALESGNDEKMFKVAEKLGYKPLSDKANQVNELEDDNNLTERAEIDKHEETPLQSIPNQTQIRTQYPKYRTKNQGYIGRYSPQKLKQIPKLSNRALLETARNINSFSNKDLLKQTVAAEARKRGIVVGEGFEIKKDSNIATITNGPKEVGLSGNQGKAQFNAQFPSKTPNVSANLQRIVDRYIGNTQSFQHDYGKALQDVKQMVEKGRVSKQQANTYLQNLRAVYDQIMPAIQDGAIRMGKEHSSNRGENFSFHSADDTAKGASYKGNHPESTQNDFGIRQQISAPQALQQLEAFKNKVAKSHAGKSMQVVTDDGTEFNAQYKVIDADDIIASNKADNTFAPNKLYPSELQPRNRASVAMQGQVRQMAANLRPADLGESRNLNTGAPLINDNGVVENGNGRVMAITRALKGGSEAGKNYKQYLVDNADKYGLNATIIQGMKAPVLVRQRLDDVDTNKIITSTAGGAVMGATEQGLSDAKRLDTNTLRKYVENDNGDLTTGGNRNFVISALKDIVGKDMGKFNALLTADGDVSQQGITRVRNALFAKAYKDNGLLAIMSESTDNNIRTITNAMLNAAPYIAEIQARMNNGSLYDYNLAGEVTAACKKLVALRDEGKPVSTYLVEQSMFGEELSDAAKNVISFFDRNKNSAKKINAMLQRASKLVENLGDPNQGQLYGEVKMPTVSEIYNKAIGDVEGEESNSQGELFNAETKSGTGKARSEENRMDNGVLEGKPGSNGNFQQDKQAIQDERSSVQQKEIKEKNKTPNNRSEKNQSGTSMPQKAEERIEDFGEKIGGAKKDLWKSYRQSMDAIPDADVANSSLAKIFPELNYQKALENGMHKDIVSMIRSLRDVIPNKPRGTRYSAQKSLQIWAEETTFMREKARQLMNGEISPSVILESLNLDTKLGQEMRFQYDLYTELGHDNSFKKFGIRKHNKGVSMIAGQTWNPEKPVWEVYYSPKGKDGKVFSYANKTVSFAEDYETALKKTIKKIPEFLDAYDEKASAKKTNYIAYSYVRGGKQGFYVGKKIGGKTVDLAGPFSTAQEALSYRANNTAELDKKLDEYKYVPSERKAENAPRVGNDWRKGKDISPKMLSETFGFRGIEFGNYVENARRQNDLNRAFDSLTDLANVIGVDTKALSLNGSLGLAFGARGSGSAAAHYEPIKVVINLTKNNGAGSLAHEWWHAFDNAIAQQERNNPTNFATGMVSNKNMFEKIRKPVVAAFEEIERAIRYSGMYNRSKNMNSAYWIRPTELGARAFEKFVNDKMNEAGYSNDYLANIQDLETFKAVGKDDRYPYPTKEEAEKINDKFQKLFDVLEQKETDKGIELYSVKEPGYNSIIMTDNELVQAAKESFPNAKNIASNGSSVSFELPNGSKMTIDLVNGIVATAEDRERASKEHGIPVTSNSQLQGSMQTIGIDGLMQLTRDSEKGTIDHEAMEFAKKIAFTPKENADMDRLLPGKEAQCNAYRDWQKQGKGSLGKLWRKIQDIINQVKAYFGSAEAKSRLELEKYYKQVASGEVFNNKPHSNNNIATAYNTNGDEAEARLKSDEVAWHKTVDDFSSGELKGKKIVDVMTTPLVLKFANAKALPIRIRLKTLDKILNGKHAYQISAQNLKDLPRALTNPAMLLYSATNASSNDVVIAVNLKDKNKSNIIVSLLLNVTDRGYDINKIKSVYSKDKDTGENTFLPRDKWFVEQAQKGNVIYINKKITADMLSNERLMAQIENNINGYHLHSSIKTEEDLVKLKKTTPAQYSGKADVSLFRNKGRSPRGYEDALLDANGKPLTFFHGTPNSFDSYDVNHMGRTNNGEQGLVWFTDSAKAADSFSYEKLDSNKSSFIQEKGEKGVVKQAALIMQQPLDLRNLSDKDVQNLWTLPGIKKEFASYNEFTDKMKHWSEIGNSRLMKVTILSSVENPVKEYNKHIKILQKMGYDGIIADMGKEYDHASEYGVFDTKQIRRIPSAADVSYSIKSAAGNFIKKLSKGENGKETEEEFDTPEARGNAAVSHNPKAPIKQRIMDVKKAFYKDWIDSLEPINKLQKQIEIFAGEKLDYEHDVYKRARMANSFAIGRANMLVSGENPKEVIKAINQSMKTDVKLKNDVTLQSVFEIIPDKEMKSKYTGYFKRGGFKNSHDVLSTYLMASRLLELQDAKRQNINRIVKEMSATRKDLKFTEKERASKLGLLEKELKEWDSVPEYKGPISNADAKAIVENAPEEFQKAADAYYKFNDNMLAIAEDAGLISHEMHTMLSEKYSHYAPMLRDFSDTAAFDKFMGALGGKGVVNVTTFLKRITKFGSERNVIDPLESTIKNLFAICDKAERNKVAQIFVNLSEDNKAGKFAMPVETTSSDPNNSIFTVMVNGEKQAFKTDPEFYGALAGYTEAPASIVSSLFRSTAQALRTGATISPDFIVRNLVRDTVFAGISSKTGFVPVLDSVKGMWALKHDKQLLEEFKAAGVPMSNFVGTNRRSAVLTLDKMAGGDKSWRTMPIKKLVSTLYEAVQDASELAESGTRMGEFMRARKQGLSIEEAGFLAKEITLDFGRAGIYGRKVNSAVPFFNACIQGSDKMYRLLRYNPRKTTIALAKYIMLPSLMLWAMNYDKDWYKELPDDIKNGSWVWKVGDTIFRFPKPQEAGVLFGSGMERFLDACATNDPKAVGDWAKYMLDVMSPNVLPTLVLPMLEWKTNYSFFTGKAVVGRREQNLPDEKQYNIYTTEFAKFLGRNTNTSPEKWDNTIKGYFGTAGALVAQSMDNLFGTEYTKAEKLWSEQPGIKGFTFTEGKRAKSVEEWYEIYNEISKEHSANGIKGHPAFYVKQANSLNKKLGELRNASTTVIMNKNLSPEQKRKYLDNIDRKKMQLAKLGVQRYRKYVKD